MAKISVEALLLRLKDKFGNMIDEIIDEVDDGDLDATSSDDYIDDDDDEDEDMAELRRIQQGL